MADEKYHIEGDTLIINDGVTTIEGADFHTYGEDGGYEDVKDEKFQNVKKVVLPDSVTEIDYDAFYDFLSLKDISLPNSIINICGYAFADCINLESVIIPDSVTSIAVDAFENCNNLIIRCNKGSYAEEFAAEKGIPIEYIDEKKYRIDRNALIINDGVTDVMGKDFHIYDEDEEGNTDYSSLKGRFEDIKTVIVPDSVTYIGEDAFCDLRSLEHIDLPNSITNISSYMFWNCTSLKSIVIPNSVTKIDDDAFRNCYKLENIVIPNSVTSIFSNAFDECKNLTIRCNKGSYAEKYAKENNISVKLIEEKYRIEGDTVIFNDGVTTIDEADFHYNDSDNMPCVFDEVKNIQHIIIPESVTSIDEFAFWDCKNLTDITIPSGVTYIGLFAFAGCESLTSITIPNNIMRIGDGTFSNCESLTSITIPNSVEKIDGVAFADCKNLTSITIPDSVTKISDDAFMDCTSLTSITISDSVISIGDYAFRGCENLTIICDKDSYAEEYAKKYKIPFEYVRQREIKEQALSDIKDYINTLAEAMKHYDGKGDVGTYLEGYVGSSGADLGAFLSETSAAYIRNCFVSAYSGVDFNYTDDKSPIERYEARINSAARQATSLAEELVNKSEKTSVEEIVDDVMHNEDFKKILKKELKAEIPENHKDDIISGKINEQDENEIIGTDINTDCPAKEDCAVYIRDIKDTILENGAGTLTLDNFGDKHYNVQIESDSEIYTFKVSLPVSKTVGGVKVQGFKELGYIDTGKDEVGKTLKEIAENTAVVTSRKNGSKSLNEIFKDNKGKTLD